MRANIKLALYNLVPVALLALLDNVIQKLTGNALFPAPPVTLAAMQANSDELKAAIEDATGGSTAARKHRNNVVAKTRDILRIQGNYVRAVGNGDAAKLASSGFTLAKRPESVPVGIPQRLQAEPTSVSGRIVLRWGRAQGARVYRVEQADVDPTKGTAQWSTVQLTTRLRLNVDGQVPYQAAWFRVSAIGINAESLPSDVVMGRAA
jgi:hypothetical protein